MFELNGDLLAGLEQLADDVEEHVVRSVAHAGALVFYEEARTLAPVYRGTEKKGVRPGQLRDAIYRAYAARQSTAGAAVYQISWNTRKAPHGYLIEHGHWLVKKRDGKKKRVRWIPPHSFIRRAFDRSTDAIVAMRDRAVQKMAEALQRSVVDDYGNAVAAEVPYDS